MWMYFFFLDKCCGREVCYVMLIDIIKMDGFRFRSKSVEYLVCFGNLSGWMEERN